MKKERITELRALAGKAPGQKSAAILELCNEVEQQAATIIHLRLRSKPPKQKAMGLGQTYGVG